MGKLFTKNEPFLDQANSSSDPSQILILEYPISGASLSPSQSLQHNPHHDHHRFLNFVLSNLTTRHKYWICQSVCQAKPLKFLIRLYTDHKNLWVKPIKELILIRASSLSKLDNTINNYSVLIINALNSLRNSRWSLISNSYLCIQPPLQSPPKIYSSTSANFHLSITPLLVHKTIHTIPTNTSIVYTSAIFHLLIFAYSHP